MQNAITLYTIVMIEFSERVEVPDRCKRCIALSRLATRYQHVSEVMDDLTEAGLSGRVTDDLVEMLVHSTDMSREEAQEVVDSNKSDINDKTVHMLDKMDEFREMQVKIAQKMIEACEHGTLAMRATQGDQQVTVRLCMSDLREVLPETPGAEIVTVERRIVEP